MTYAFDTSSVSTLRFIFQSRFLNFWSDIQNYVIYEKIISTREVKNELDVRFQDDEQILKWATENRDIFLVPTLAETTFVEQIFLSKKFKALLEAKRFLQGGYFADPFIIALAKVKNACVVTEEKEKPNSSSIPNICKEFKIECTNLEGFMTKENLKY